MGREISVLIVDDSEDDAELMVRSLRRGGFEPDWERVCEKARLADALDRRRWDVILSDFSMPGFGGLEALSVVNALENAPPFIVVSGAIGEETAVELMRGGAHDFIKKDNLARLSQVVTREIEDETVRSERREALLSLRRELKLNSIVAELAKKLISSADDLESVSGLILRKAMEFTTSANGMIALAGEKGAEIQPVLFAGNVNEGCGVSGICGSFSFKKTGEGRYAGFWSRTLNEGEPFFENSPGSIAHPPALPKGHVQIERILTVPAIIEGEPAGIITIANPTRDYGIHDLAAVGQLADLLSLAVMRRRADAEKENLSAQLRRSQKAEAIGTLAGGIAHDFNNILTPLIGYAEMVQLRLQGGSEINNYQDEVLKACGRAQELVGQILAFSRRSKEEPKSIEVQSIVKEAAKLLRAAIPSNIEMSLDIDDNCGSVLADPINIHQVIVNLCTNAYQSMLGSGGVMKISLREVLPRQLDGALGLSPVPHVLLSVQDTGKGMDKATMEKVFDPYFTTKSKEGGSGLGLAVALGIVKKAGGAIAVESKPGAGSVFRVYLPVVAEDSSASLEAEAEAQVGGGSERLMIVDDETSILSYFTELFESLGYEVEGFSSSVKALEAFQSAPERYDVLVTDMVMPAMSGAELAQKVHALRPELPIVLCTGTGLGKSLGRESLAEKGIVRVVQKPVTINNLTKTIRDVIGRG